MFRVVFHHSSLRIRLCRPLSSVVSILIAFYVVGFFSNLKCSHLQSIQFFFCLFSILLFFHLFYIVLFIASNRIKFPSQFVLCTVRPYKMIYVIRVLYISSSFSLFTCVYSRFHSYRYLTTISIIKRTHDMAPNTRMCLYFIHFFICMCVCACVLVREKEEQQKKVIGEWVNLLRAHTHIFILVL